MMPDSGIEARAAAKVRAGRIDGAHLLAGPHEEHDAAIDDLGGAVLARHAQRDRLRLAVRQRRGIARAQPQALATGQAGREHGAAENESDSGADRGVHSLNGAHEKEHVVDSKARLASAPCWSCM